MKKSRVISFLLALMLAFPYTTAFAEKGQLSDFREDDVFRFDLNEDFLNVEIEKDDETFIMNEAEEIAVAFGLMLKDGDGNFRSNEFLKYNEYIYALKTLAETETEPTASEDSLSFEDAVSGVLALLGYEEYMYQGKEEWMFAISLGLVNASDNRSKKITRREFAQMLYNSYTIPMLKKVIVQGPSTSVSTDNTLLDNKDIEKIRGFVNAVPGINVFSNARPEENNIEIDRVKYSTELANLSEYLGRHVQGYAKYNDDIEEWELLYVRVSEKDKRIFGNLRDIVSISEDEITYLQEGKNTRRTKLNGMKNIVVNGDHIRDIKSVIELHPEDYDGYFMLSQSDESTYDTLVIWKYDGFVINSIDKTNKRLHLKYSAQFDGKGYVEVPKDECICEVIRDGKIYNFSTLEVGNHISVAQSSDKKYTSIIVSNDKIEGTISGIDENIVIIDDAEHYVSLSYAGSSEGEAFILGDDGTFYLTYFGSVCGYEKRRSTDIFYAYLRKIKIDTDTVDDKVMIEVFNDSGEWKKYYLREKVQLDGTFVKEKGIITRFVDNASTYEDTMIRLKLDENNEVSMIDTITDSVAEKDDKKRLELMESNINSCLYFGGGIFIHNTKYKFKNSAKIFYLPEDRTDKDEFKILHVSNFETDNSNTTYTFDLYTADNFYFCDLVICHDFVRKDKSVFYVTKVHRGIGPDELPEWVLDGYHFSFGSSKETSYRIEESVMKEITDSGFVIEKDRLLLFQGSSGYVDSVLESKDCSSTQFIMNPSTQQAGYISGMIKKIDVAEKIIMVEYIDADGNKTDVSLIHLQNSPKRVLGRGPMETIELAELNPGDKVLLQFGWGYFYSLLVFEDESI